MVIVEAGDLWIVCGDVGGGTDGPLVGFDADYREQLEARYGQYCLSIKAQQGCLTCRGVDLDLVSLDEGKSISAWRSSARKNYGQKIRTNPSYRRMITKEESLATRQFQAAVREFRKDLQSQVAFYLRGTHKMSTLRRATVEGFRQIYTRAWETGRRASGILKLQKKVRPPSREEEQWFRSAVREELTFWNNFLDELGRDKEFKTRAFSVPVRVDMYADTVWFMFQVARLSGLPDNVLLHWFPTQKRSGEMCPGCRFMVDHSPFPRDVMPTTPKAGDTPCLMRCVHKVVVRFVPPKQVEKRRLALPSKESMLRSLRGIMSGKVKKYKRKRNKQYNPWLGQTTWGELR